VFELITLVLQTLAVNVVRVYTQLYGHCSEHLEPMTPGDRAAWASARETVHTDGGTQDRAGAPLMA
jgi:hypothetical protein